MTDAEDDGGGLGPLGSRQAVERRARQVDLAAERVAGGAVPLAAEGRRGGVLPLGELDLYGVAVRLDAREPLPCRATEAGGERRGLGNAPRSQPAGPDPRPA